MTSSDRTWITEMTDYTFQGLVFADSALGRTVDRVEVDGVPRSGIVAADDVRGFAVVMDNEQYPPIYTELRGSVRFYFQPKDAGAI